jgi:hypothetical protein
MATSTTSRPAPQPATGTARWASADPAAALRLGAAAALVIRTATRAGEVAAGYVVRPILDGGQLVGYRLEKADDEGPAAYDLPADLSSCTCPDHTWRGRPCKHMGGLLDALQRINLL